MQTDAGNGGFPEPPVDQPQRLVLATHAECGAETRVRLPRAVPARAVRRVVCDHCEAAYECDSVEELGMLPAGASAASEGAAPPVEPQPVLPTPAVPRPRLRLPSFPQIDSSAWRYGSALVAAAAVVTALVLLEGGDSATGPNGRRTAAARVAGSNGGGPVSTEARFVTAPGYSLALPPGWQRIPPKGGAAFAARAADGTGTATLWIQRAANLSFPQFVQRSLTQLRSLAGTAEVVDRQIAPTDAGTVVRLRANAPAGSGVSAPYDVTLRVAGPYRYYLSTTLRPGASPVAVEGADLIHGSFVPEPNGSQDVTTGPTPGAGAAPAPQTDSGSATP